MYQEFQIYAKNTVSIPSCKLHGSEKDFVGNVPGIPNLCKTRRAFRPVNYMELAGIFRAMYQESQISAKKRRTFRPVNYIELVGIFQAMYQEFQISAKNGGHSVL